MKKLVKYAQWALDEKNKIHRKKNICQKTEIMPYRKALLKTAGY